jgi:hypothetical protein
MDSYTHIYHTDEAEYLNIDTSIHIYIKHTSIYNVKYRI